MTGHGGSRFGWLEGDEGDEGREDEYCESLLLLRRGCHGCVAPASFSSIPRIL